MPWTIQTLNPTVDAELATLPDDMVARFRHISDLIRDMGLERVRHPHVDHLQGALWEMRLRGKAGIARALYVTASGQRVVIVRVFVKKTQKTPPSEIRIALQRARDVK
jgi:phage-related protein